MSTNHEILIQNNRFVPNELTIDIGDTVLFVWGIGAAGHNVAQTDSSSSLAYNDGFRSGDPQSSPLNWTLPDRYVEEEGILYFICEPHVSSDAMRGKIVVGSPQNEINLGNNTILWISIIGGTLLIFSGFVIIILKQSK